MFCYLKNTLKSRFRCTIDNTALYKHNSRKTVGSSRYKSSKKPFRLRNYSKFDVYREKDIYIKRKRCTKKLREKQTIEESVHGRDGKIEKSKKFVEHPEKVENILQRENASTEIFISFDHFDKCISSNRCTNRTRKF